MTKDELIIGTVYKLFDTEKNGAIIYGAARFDGIDKKGYKFSLMHTVAEEPVWMDSEFMDKLILQRSYYKKK